MRRILQIAILLLLAAALVGCSHKPQPKQLTFHVTAVTPCDSITGTYADREYRLVISRFQDESEVPAYIACWEPIGAEAVGKDFSASVFQTDFAVIVPNLLVPEWLHSGRKVVIYQIASVREVK